MQGRVTDDASLGRCAEAGTHRFSQTNILSVLGFVLALAAASPGPAQEPSMEVTVRQIQEKPDWIHIPVNKSVLIETSKPATRQQTLSPEIASIQSISPTQVLVTGESFGRTQVIIWSGEERKVFDVSVELELDLLKDAIRRVDRLSEVDAFPIMDTVVLSGTVSDAEAADRILQIASIFASNIQNHLQVAGEQQVLLRVTIAEMSRSILRQLGINGFMVGENVRDFPFLSNIGAVNPSSFGFGPGRVTNNLPIVTQGTAVGDGPTLSFAFPRIQLQVFMQALNENGLLKVLAEPNLVTISGRTASFLAGGEFPIPVPQSLGTGSGNTITIEFREFGARLAFTPVVLANQMIRLNVAPEVSELDFAQGVSIGGFTVPGLNVRRSETTVEVGNGQSLTISGLLSENVRAVSSRIPGLGQLPVLGALFASTEYRRNLTELVIVVTPELVSGVNPDQVAELPGGGYVSPDDWQLFMLGMLEGQQPLTPAMASVPAEATEEAVPGDGTAQVSKARTSVPDYLDVDNDQLSLFGPWGQSDYDETSTQP